MADCDTLLTGMDYHDKFDPSVYLTYKYGEGCYTDSVNFNLRCYDDAFQSLPSELVKAVVHCDLTQDPPIDGGYDQQYDVVVTNLCISTAAQTQEDYRLGVAKLGKLVISGGVLMIYDAERSGSGSGYYYVESAKFRDVCVSSEFVAEAMRDAGFINISVQQHAIKFPDPHVMGFMFLEGKKK